MTVACGDNTPGPHVGTPVELPLLTTLVDRPFNHSAEVTVAARDGRVVVASINFRFADATNFDAGGAGEFRKRVALHVSSDGGRTFEGANDPGFGTDGTAFGDETTDPVVRVSESGTFFLCILRTGLQNGNGVVARSDDGIAWTPIFDDYFQDKPWIAVESPGDQIWIGAVGGFWRMGRDGQLSQQIITDGSMKHLMVDAYAHAGRARFATAGTAFEGEMGRVPRILEWDGTPLLPQHVVALDAGIGDLGTVMAWSHGPLPNGAWSVRVRRGDAHAELLLRTEIDGVVTEAALTDSTENAFMPAAAVDRDGRLHIVWYDSAGPAGMLMYMHSLGPAPWNDGFTERIVVDANATPGDGWWPGGSTATGGRRLREYIGLAIDDEVVHVAWTHAPEPPSRVWVSTVTPRRSN